MPLILVRINIKVQPPIHHIALSLWERIRLMDHKGEWWLYESWVIYNQIIHGSKGVEPPFLLFYDNL